MNDQKPVVEYRNITIGPAQAGKPSALHDFSTAQLQHIIATQLPGLVDEAQKRLLYAPFIRDSMYIEHHADKHSVVLQHLARIPLELPTWAAPASVLAPHTMHIKPEMLTFPGLRPLHEVSRYCRVRALSVHDTEKRMTGFTYTMRGQLKVLADDLPLYLDISDTGWPAVYPLFDWTDAQVWAYLMHHHLLR